MLTDNDVGNATFRDAEATLYRLGVLDMQNAVDAHSDLTMRSVTPNSVGNLAFHLHPVLNRIFSQTRP